MIDVLLCDAEPSSPCHLEEQNKLQPQKLIWINHMQERRSLFVEIHNEYQAKTKKYQTELAFADAVHIWVISIRQ